MFSVQDKYLSGDAQIISWCESYTTVLNDILSMEQTINADNSMWLSIIYESEQHAKLIGQYKVLNVFLENRLNPHDGVHAELSDGDEEYKLEKNWITQAIFLENYAENINGENYITIHIWTKQDPNDENRCLKLTDCIINTENEKFRASIAVLAKSSEVIFNLVNDLKQQKKQYYDFDSPMDLSKIFEGFSSKHIHIYLCAVYNPNFKFFKLDDIIHVLKISLKLDNQSLSQRILNTEGLGQILKDQGKVESESSEDPCYIENILEFAYQHRLHQLILFCEACYLNSKKLQTYSNELKRFIENS